MSPAYCCSDRFEKVAAAGYVRGTNKILALSLSLILLATPASAQTWTGPDPERRPGLFGQGDIDFVLSELCLPFVVQDG